MEYYIFRIEPFIKEQAANYVSQQQQNIKYNIFQYQIQDIRIIDVHDNQTCGYDEILVQGSEYPMQNKKSTIYMMPIHDENGTKQLKKLCFKQLQGYSYQKIQSFLTQSITNYDCNYNQVSFSMSEESKRCPISSVIFSSEEEIQGYDKISIANNNKYRFFVKRNDSNSTPLVNIYISSSEEQEIRTHKDMNITYSLNDLSLTEKQLSKVVNNRYIRLL
ncbi:hypothetical protein ABPG72_020540 [Tetrahymena utriculariae]